jgi:hypothetical protein
LVRRERVTLLRAVSAGRREADGEDLAAGRWSGVVDRTGGPGGSGCCGAYRAWPFDGISPAPINSLALDFADIANIASEIPGPSIVRETVSDEEYRTALVAHGLPEVMADALSSLYKGPETRGHEGCFE